MSKPMPICALLAALALSACASQPSAPRSQPQECPAPPTVPAWVMEPEPDPLPLLDKLITPVPSSPPKQSPLTTPSAPASAGTP
ncbi:hypothetical protein C7389_109101 [Azoarcus indigens]|uniref:Uncharacterized protein n=1 Tax=Azoarcus indigens TaxID=29545 RepID=A0A4R6DYI1_9RHOO|nr:hypothetical protein C7389_109101 [Azoarcus indigens]